jgi:hypothetical protein
MRKMLLIGAKLKHEVIKIFRPRRNVIFLILFALVAVFFVYSGIVEYKDFQKEKALFITHEKNKVDLYVTYSQYGDYGFRVLYEPSPLCLFFNNSSVFENLYSNVDLTEILKVNTSYKGRNLLQKKGFFKDLAGLFFLFGSLFMVYMGMASLKSGKVFFKFGNLILRLVILVIVFLGVVSVLQRLPKLFALQFSPGESKIFPYFVLFLLCFLSFFYAAGLFIRMVSRKSQRVYIYIFIFWFFSVSVVPECMTIFLHNKSQLLEANAKYNIMKLEEVMNFEKKVQKAIVGIKTLGERNKIYQKMVKHFLDHGYRKNTKIEEGINNNIKRVMREYESVMQLYPTSFFNFFCGELSSKGYGGYIDLVNYTLKLRHEFIQYYLKKRYESNDKNIIPFVKGEENIFRASSRVPRSFFVGAGLTLALTIILFLASYFVFIRRSRRVPPVKKPRYKFRKGDTYFLLCKNEQFKNDLFASYQAEKDTICIDNVNADEIDTGVGLTHMISYFCKITGVEKEAALKNLRMLAMGDPYNRKWNKEKLPAEIVQKMYCAISMAGDREMIVVKDFLKGKSRELERLFLNLVNRLNNSGKIVVYLSTEMFLTLLPFEKDIKISSYKSFKIDPQAVSLR